MLSEYSSQRFGLGLGLQAILLKRRMLPVVLIKDYGQRRYHTISDQIGDISYRVITNGRNEF